MADNPLPAADPSTILDAMSERARLVAIGYVREPRDVPRLIAAVRAVLRLADEADGVLSFPPADCANACGDGPCNCSGNSRPAGWDLDPEAVREAITRELTGEADDET